MHRALKISDLHASSNSFTYLRLVVWKVLSICLLDILCICIFSLCGWGWSCTFCGTSPGTSVSLPISKQSTHTCHYTYNLLFSFVLRFFWLGRSFPCISPDNSKRRGVHRILQRRRLHLPIRDFFWFQPSLLWILHRMVCLWCLVYLRISRIIPLCIVGWNIFWVILPD